MKRGILVSPLFRPSLGRLIFSRYLRNVPRALWFNDVLFYPMRADGSDLRFENIFCPAGYP